MDQYYNDQPRHFLRSLSSLDFLIFGSGRVAYIKTVRIDGRPAYALHGADGTPLSLIDSFEGAIIIARQNDLEPVSLQ